MEFEESPRTRVNRSPSLPHAIPKELESVDLLTIPDLLEWYWEIFEERCLTEDGEKEKEEDEDEETKIEFIAFDEVVHPIDRDPLGSFSKKDKENLREWLSSIFAIGQLAGEALSLSRIYVEKALKKGFPLSMRTARWLFLSCIVAASKFWEDTTVWLEDFAECTPLSHGDHVARIERELLMLLEYDMEVSAAEYWGMAKKDIECKRRSGPDLTSFRISNSVNGGSLILDKSFSVCGGVSV